MMQSSPNFVSCKPIAPHHDEHDLRVRISAEFREMPGLTLTLAQASRLFSLEPMRCERVLGSLVEGGVLSTNGRAFARAGAGRRWA
jgi:hypothetical protein